MHGSTTNTNQNNQQLSQSEINNQDTELNFIAYIEDLPPLELRYHYQQSLNLIADSDISFLFNKFILMLTREECNNCYNQVKTAVAGDKN